MMDLDLEMIDVADSYCSGDAEEFLGKIKGEISSLRITTKVGGYRNRLPRPLNDKWTQSRIIQKTRILWHGGYYDFNPLILPNTLESALRGSLKRINRDHVDIYLLHGIPQHASLDEFVGQLIKLREKGMCEKIGISLESQSEIDLSWCDYVQTPLSLFEKGLNFNGRLIVRSLHSQTISMENQIRSLQKSGVQGYVLTGTQNQTHFNEFANAIKL